MLDGMTNIKASEVLKELKFYTEDLPPYSPDEVAEAIEMAIQAFEAQPTGAKETIIKSVLKYLVKRQIEEGSVGFAVDNDHDHDCCWDDVLAWIEAQPCENAVSREAVKNGMIKYGFHAPDMTVTEFVEDCLPSVTPQASEDDIHREREQAYMLGYEDASKRFRTEPCEDCISRQAVLNIFNEWFATCNIADKRESPKAKINALPSVTPQRPKGKWIKCKSRFGVEYFKCSECGRKLHWIDRDDNYCNDCGSDNSESTKVWFKEWDTKLTEMSGGGEE